MLRVGIISANWGAIAHLPAWRGIPGVEVVGICTSRRETAEAAAERFSIARPFWDAQAMIADPEIDIVDCGTRPGVRHPMVLSALNAGKHVYNGIPFAPDVQAARTLYDAAQKSEAAAVVDAYSQWLPAPRRAREMIDEGFLGKPFGGSCFFNLALFNQPMAGFPWNWFAEAGHGVSAMRNLGSHMLHMLVYLFGEVEELIAEDRQLLDEWRFLTGETTKAETNDFANLFLRFKSGMTMPIQLCWTAAVGTGFRIEAFGDKGRMALASPSFPTTLDTVLIAGKLGEYELAPVDIPDSLIRPEGVALEPSIQPAAAHGMAIAMNDMVGAIRDGRPAAPDFAQAWHVEQILEAARVSSAERRWVCISEIA